MLKNLTNKNSTTWKVNTKILVFGIILILVLVGLFSPMRKASAAETDTGVCSISDASGGTTTSTTTKAACSGTWVSTAPAAATTPKPGTPSEFEKEINKDSYECGVLNGTLYPGCFIKISFALFYQFPAYLLGLVAYFFNVMVSVTLSSSLLKDPFVGQAWGVVRDLSNIFFILILLYIAIKVILGIGGSEVKKMVAKVIIIALLINFSMFFTQIVIDTSNILALIFYNKVSVATKGPNDTVIERDYASVGGEKDVSGGLVSAFNPTKTLSPEFFAQSKKVFVNGQDVTKEANPKGTVPTSVIFGLIVMAGIIMGIAIYALLITAFSFLGRLIELWILIIFSPFAFMSSTLPLFSGVEYLGWEAWSKRLLKVAFMAPIFMFFLYFIFLLISSNIFTKLVQPSAVGQDDAAGIIKMLLGVVIPAVFVCVLLLKATKFAKEGSGAIGEMVLKGAKMAGGLALGAVGGAAMGAVAIGGRATVGRIGSAISNSETIKRWEKEGKYGGSFAAAKLRDAGKTAGSASFDVRGASIGGKTLASATGMNLGKAQEGGFEKKKKEQIESRTKRAKELESGEGTPEKRKASSLEAGLRTAKANKAQDLNKVEKEIGDLRQKMQDQKAAGLDGDAAKTYAELEGKKKEKKNITGSGMGAIDPKTGKPTHEKDSIADFESRLNEANNEINAKEIASMNKYADLVESTGSKFFNTIVTLGQYSSSGADMAADRIRKGVKIEETKK